MKIFNVRDKIISKFEEMIGNDRIERVKKFPKLRERIFIILEKRKIITPERLKFLSILITFFGSGKSRYAPGTAGSLTAILLWWTITMFFCNYGAESFYETIFWLIICLLLFIYGILIIPIYSENIGSEDHPSVVIDEAVGQILALCITYPFVKEFYSENALLINRFIIFAHLFSSFIFFRFFDIIKPSIIGWVDRNMNNSFGVMLDDILSGLVAAAMNIAIFFTFQNSYLSI